MPLVDCWWISRVNISNALTMEMPTELHLVGHQTNIVLTIFFAPYILFEIPSNILLKRFSPRVWCMPTPILSLLRVKSISDALQCLDASWPSVLSCFVKVSVCPPFKSLRICLRSTVKSYSGLLATRFFLGVAEAGVFPGSKLQLNSL